MTETVKDVAARSKTLALAQAKLPEPRAHESSVNTEALQTAAAETAEVAEASLERTAITLSNYGVRSLEMTGASLAAAFDLVGKLMSAKSPSQAIEISGEHSRAQFERLAFQRQELWSLVYQAGVKSVGYARAVSRTVL